MLCIGTNAAVAYRLLESMKIRRVEVWAANSAGNASNTITLEWTKTADFGGPGKVVSDTALGIANVACVSTPPDKSSLASDWIGTAANTLFQITLPQGAVLDLLVDISLFDTDAPVAVTAAVAGATVGKLYCRALDNQNATPVILPVGYDYI